MTEVGRGTETLGKENERSDVGVESSTAAVLVAGSAPVDCWICWSCACWVRIIWRSRFCDLVVSVTIRLPASTTCPPETYDLSFLFLLELLMYLTQTRCMLMMRITCAYHRRSTDAVRARCAERMTY